MQGELFSGAEAKISATRRKVLPGRARVALSILGRQGIQWGRNGGPSTSGQVRVTVTDGSPRFASVQHGSATTKNPASQSVRQPWFFSLPQRLPVARYPSCFSRITSCRSPPFRLAIARDNTRRRAQTRTG
ncbi:hypothetical protein BDV95DRAFT_222069 [Massariosphaeria phaeospora]|uniref:Uncharacterized protein n=1 Tax=Massariosphaeria phaeospora TaxID=100035 RepID=A0A7C8MH07_9PLEO|nr:hypothetical protein BDV95DRAFT_222069 [Massariosphaeria phaeospora]